jgi:hypothetical protein
LSHGSQSACCAATARWCGRRLSHPSVGKAVAGGRVREALLHGVRTPRRASPCSRRLLRPSSPAGAVGQGVGCSGPAPARSGGGARRTGRGPRWHYPRVQSSGRYCRGWSTSPTLTKTMSHTQQLRTRTTSKPNLRCLSGALVGELGEMAGDDEVLPRHPDALEDPWTTTRASRSRDQGI